MMLIWIAAVLAALICAYMFMIAPCIGGKADMRALRGKYCAHRGLHDGNRQIPENSMEAFRRAVDAGYGIELDVRLTRDGKLVVHHDASAARMCGLEKNIGDIDYDELRTAPLSNGESVPLFADVLALVAGRVPLIVEIKQDKDPRAVGDAALEALKGYGGPYCVESFDPRTLVSFRRNAPHVARGQLSSNMLQDRKTNRSLPFLIVRTLLANAVSRPHFVAYSFPEDNTLGMWMMRRVFRPRLAAWTIRSRETAEAAFRRGYDLVIFELFTPEEK